MFCTKCGNQLNEGIKFCTKCGAPVSQVAQADSDVQVTLAVQTNSDAQTAPEADTNTKVETAPEANTNPEVDKKKVPKWPFFVGGAVIITALIAGGTILVVNNFASKLKDKFIAKEDSDEATENNEEDVVDVVDDTIAENTYNISFDFTIFAPSDMDKENLLEQATVSIYEGTECDDDSLVQVIDIDDVVDIEAELSNGTYTLMLEGENILTQYVPLTVNGSDVESSGYLVGKAGDDSAVVVLTWDDVDLDLDLYAYASYENINNYFIMVGGEQYQDARNNQYIADSENCVEVIYINDASSDNIKILVNDATNANYGYCTESYALCESGANVNVYINDELVYEDNVASDESGVVWQVVDINGGMVNEVQPDSKLSDSTIGENWEIYNKNEKIVKAKIATITNEATGEVRYSANAYNLNGQDLITIGYSIFKQIYDEQNILIGNDYWSFYGDINSSRWVYDENGNITEQFDGTGRMTAKNVIIQYDDNTRVTEIYFPVNPDRDDSELYLSMITEEAYDDAGNMISNILYNADNTVSVYYLYKYDEYNNLIEEEEYRYNTLIAKTEYTYDRWNRKIKRTNSQGYGGFEIVYDYDSRSNCKHEYEYDSNGTLLYTREYEYYYYDGTESGDGVGDNEIYSYLVALAYGSSKYTPTIDLDGELYTVEDLPKRDAEYFQYPDFYSSMDTYLNYQFVDFGNDGSVEMVLEYAFEEYTRNAYYYMVYEKDGKLYAKYLGEDGNNSWITITDNGIVYETGGFTALWGIDNKYYFNSNGDVTTIYSSFHETYETAIYNDSNINSILGDYENAKGDKIAIDEYLIDGSYYYAVSDNDLDDVKNIAQNYNVTICSYSELEEKIKEYENNLGIGDDILSASRIYFMDYVELDY